MKRGRTKITSTLKPEKIASKGHYVMDTELPGFGIRVGTNYHSYVIRYAGRTVVLGRTYLMTVPGARSAARELLLQAQHGVLPPVHRGPKLTMAGLAERYQDEYSGPHKKASSQAGDRRNWYNHILPAIVTTGLGKMPLRDVRVDQIEPEMIDEFHQSLRATPTSANRCVALLSSAFTLSERWRIRPQGSNPARGIKKFPERQKTRVFHLDELRALAASVNELEALSMLHPSHANLIRAMAYTGRRAADLIDTRADDLDWERGLLRTETKTGPDIVTLPRQVLDALRGATTEYLFPAPRNPRAPAPKNGFIKAWGRVRKHAGLPSDLTPHTLRHTYRSLAGESGVPVELMKAIGGWSSDAMADHYMHASTGAKAKAAQQMGDLVDGVFGGEA